MPGAAFCPPPLPCRAPPRSGHELLPRLSTTVDKPYTLPFTCCHMCDYHQHRGPQIGTPAHRPRRTQQRRPPPDAPRRPQTRLATSRRPNTRSAIAGPQASIVGVYRSGLIEHWGTGGAPDVLHPPAGDRPEATNPHEIRVERCPQGTRRSPAYVYARKPHPPPSRMPETCSPHHATHMLY